jgi:hypothetical protein
MPDQSEEKENFERIYVTPKRHRKAPLLLPLGLSVEDFNALEDPRIADDEQVSLPPHTPQAGESTSDELWTLDEFGNWTAADDKASRRDCPGETQTVEAGVERLCAPPW